MPHLPFKCLSFGLFLKQYFNKAWKQTKFKPLLYLICLKKNELKMFHVKHFEFEKNLY